MRKINILSFIAVSVFHNYCAGQTVFTKDSLAEKMLQYQLPNGAWPKQLADKSVVDYRLPLTKELLQKIRKTTIDHATLDNGATTREINGLIKAFQETKNLPEITYNDNAMINSLLVLYKVANKQDGFEAINPIFVSKAQIAVEKGIICILKTQVMQNGKRSIWAAQYDQNTLKPAQARKFEPASLSTSESVAIVRFLMLQPATNEIKQAIEHAIKWFQQHDIEGYRFDRIQDNLTGKYQRQLVADPTSTIWARFYHLEDNRPLLGDRDDTIKYNFEEVSEERRNGYAWFGNWPEKLIQKEYPKGKKQYKIQ